MPRASPPNRPGRSKRFRPSDKSPGRRGDGDAKHPSPLSALEAKGSGSGRMEINGIGDGDMGGDEHATLNAIGALFFNR